MVLLNKIKNKLRFNIRKNYNEMFVELEQKESQRKVNIWFRVFEYCQDQSPLKGEIEVDESYFGARGKIIVFGLLLNENALAQSMISISKYIQKNSKNLKWLY